MRKYSHRTRIHRSHRLITPSVWWGIVTIHLLSICFNYVYRLYRYTLWHIMIIMHSIIHSQFMCDFIYQNSWHIDSFCSGEGLHWSCLRGLAQTHGDQQIRSGPRHSAAVLQSWLQWLQRPRLKQWWTPLFCYHWSLWNSRSSKWFLNILYGWSTCSRL